MLLCAGLFWLAAFMLLCAGLFWLAALMLLCAGLFWLAAFMLLCAGLFWLAAFVLLFVALRCSIIVLRSRLVRRRARVAVSGLELLLPDLLVLRGDRLGVRRAVRAAEGLVRARKRRSAVIDGCKLIAILTGEVRLVLLIGCRRASVLAGLDLSVGRRQGRAALATIVAYVMAVSAEVAVVDDRLIVGVVDHGPVHVGHGRVVAEVVAAPATAVEAGARIAEAVADAAIEADAGAPVTGVPAEAAAAGAPVAGRPE